MKRLLLPLLLTFTTASFSGSGRAQAAADAEPDDLRAILEVMRSDVNGSKIRTLNQVMLLTPTEAEQFWPIYRQYEKDLAAVGDRKLALIREFAARRAENSLDSKAWNSLAQKWLRNAEERVQLWKKYQKKISKGVSAMRAAQFLQVEHQMALLIDINVASEMPLLGLGGKPRS